jgi:hypothetical protein
VKLRNCFSKLGGSTRKPHCLCFSRCRHPLRTPWRRFGNSRVVETNFVICVFPTGRSGPRLGQAHRLCVNYAPASLQANWSRLDNSPACRILSRNVMKESTCATGLVTGWDTPDILAQGYPRGSPSNSSNLELDRNRIFCWYICLLNYTVHLLNIYTRSP